MFQFEILFHFLFSHPEKVPEHLGDGSDEQGERFHQDIKVMETRYQARWDANMMADYCWNLKGDCPDIEHKKITQTKMYAITVINATCYKLVLPLICVFFV